MADTPGRYGEETVTDRDTQARSVSPAPPKERLETRIEDHGVIGDLGTVALVGLDGTIDFMCWPDFDSPSMFASLLDVERGGFFSLCPSISTKHKQLYLPDTNVLLTRSLAPAGVLEITDLMPIEDGRGRTPRLVRIAHVVRGAMEIKVRCAPRFDYARARHRVQSFSPTSVVFWPEGGPPMKLSATVPLSVEGDDAVATFALEKGESATFVFEAHEEPERSPASLPAVGMAWFESAVAYWRHWATRSSYQGRWREIVGRSALALKLLTSRRHGAIVAAPTFGLPETPGGIRNWDYRYAWIRDAGFSVYALMRLGYTEEADAFVRWVHDRLAGDAASGGPLQVMYAVDGRRELVEVTLDSLSGYRGARPVRIGNAAFDQLQLDIYGALLDAIYLANKYGQPVSHDGWVDVVKVVDWVVQNWRLPDEGIWEFRGGRREFLHSRLMCWVTVDRALRLAQKRSLPAPFAAWAEARNEIHASVYASFWNDEMKCFVQSKGSSELDASCLLMPLLRFISPVDPRWLSTLDMIGTKLTEDALVHRYDVVESADVDGLIGQEGAFTACSFWYVECLARAGRVDEARLLFEKMLGFANHLGLFSEELGPAGEHLGNFPQGLTHLALVSAAFTLDRELSGRRGAWER